MKKHLPTHHRRGWTPHSDVLHRQERRRGSSLRDEKNIIFRSPRTNTLREKRRRYVQQQLGRRSNPGLQRSTARNRQHDVEEYHLIVENRVTACFSGGGFRSFFRVKQNAPVPDTAN